MFKMIISAAKTMVGATIMLLAVTTTVSAQDRAAEGAKRATDKMKRELSLTDDQYPKVEQINKDFMDKAKESRATADKAQKEKGVKALSDERDAKLKTVLTEEQFKIYTDKKAQRLVKIKDSRATRELEMKKS